MIKDTIEVRVTAGLDIKANVLTITMMSRSGATWVRHVAFSELDQLPEEPLTCMTKQQDQERFMRGI